MILYNPQILQDLSSSSIFLDTNVFSVSSRCKPLVEFLTLLKNDSRCSLTTIPSVVFEFTNGSSDLTIFNQRREFIDAIVDSINPVRFINDIEDFSVVMAKVNAQNKAYTDFLSCLSL